MKRMIGFMLGLMLMAYAPTASAYNVRVVDVPCPEWQQELYGCYKRRCDEIQIKRNLSEDEKRFVLYHEIGHLFTFDRMYQFRNITTDREEVADMFAYWVLGLDEAPSFSDVCDSKCLEEIKKIKI